MSAPLSRHAIQDEVDAYLKTLFDKKVDLILYLRAGERLLHEAASYEAEGNVEEAYRKLFTYAELAATWYPTHPQYKDKRHASQLARNSQRAYKAMTQLADLKPKVEAQYEHSVAQRARQAERAKQAAASRQSQPDVRSRAAPEAANKSPVVIDEALLQTVRNLGLSRATATSARVGPSAVDAFQYPEMPSAVIRERVATAAVPAVPPKLAQNVDITTEKSSSPKTASTQFPEVATLENGSPLKTVFVSRKLRETFLDIARPNTKRNLETCGILAGSCRNNAYFVTHLVIPKQESTSDTCATTDEEGLFNFQDENELFTIGWIHTHPTQTCFLSSVDLHTHMSYQIMLPEAVAIVCSPSKTPSWGVFRVTDPPGIQALKACRQTGLFHPHAETHLYVDALQSTEASAQVGHYREATFDFKVVDQR